MKLLAAILLLLLSVTASADVKLPAIFGSSMVLQRDKPIAIWGWADKGEEVTVTLGETNTAKATADADGKWMVKLAASKATAVADGSGLMLTVKGKNTITLTNVLVGEVWICSGQSNMQWTVRQSSNADKAIAASSLPAIRLISVPRTPVAKPQQDFVGKWEVCGPETVAQFSAVGFFFGRELLQNLNVPIGLINTSYGGTPVEAWTSMASLESVPSIKPLLVDWDKRVVEQTADKIAKQNEDALKKWQDAAAKAKAENKPAPVKPRPIVEAARSQNRPANLYNGMIAPLVPLTVRGAIWYQGEGNVPRAHQYQTLFPLMIQNWRADFGADMPFGFVQLAPFRYTRNDPAWGAELWEAQLLTLKKVPNTGMAIITDVGDVKDIHPTNKEAVGQRLALWARSQVYGEKDIVYSGPIYKSHTIEGELVKIHFDHANGGLTSADGKPLTHFEVAGEDKVFKPADAKIGEKMLIVSSKEVAKPVAVRFAWRDDAEPNLTNRAGIPASPFRTDTWKGLTEGKSY